MFVHSSLTEKYNTSSTCAPFKSLSQLFYLYLTYENDKVLKRDNNKLTFNTSKFIPPESNIVTTENGILNNSETVKGRKFST